MGILLRRGVGMRRAEYCFDSVVDGMGIDRKRTGPYWCAIGGLDGVGDARFWSLYYKPH